MANVKISAKGMALLNRSYTSGSVVRAIASKGRSLATGGLLAIRVDGRTLFVKSARSAAVNVKAEQ